MNDDEFLSAFENCTLPFEEWTHRAHVRVAYMYASRFNPDDATDRMRTSIKAYNKATNTPEGIDRGDHETITQAFMKLVFVAKRIERILEKLKQVRHKGLSCFGSDSHKFRLSARLGESTLLRFESEQGVHLPPDYRCFLRIAGHGGAGPYYGMYKLDQWNDFIDWSTDDPPDDTLNLMGSVKLLLRPRMIVSDLDNLGSWMPAFGTRSSSLPVVNSRTRPLRQ